MKKIFIILPIILVLLSSCATKHRANVISYKDNIINISSDDLLMYYYLMNCGDTYVVYSSPTPIKETSINWYQSKVTNTNYNTDKYIKVDEKEIELNEKDLHVLEDISGTPQEEIVEENDAIVESNNQEVENNNETDNTTSDNDSSSDTGSCDSGCSD